MAIAVVQAKMTGISNQSNVTLTFDTAPIEGNDVVFVVCYDSDRTIVEPVGEITGSWTTGVGPVDAGSSPGGRGVDIRYAEVGSGTDTTWFWDTNPNDILAVCGIEFSGADTGGTLKTDTHLDTDGTLNLIVDGGTNPSGSMLYVVGAMSKSFGQTPVLYSNSDASMTFVGDEDTGGGTVFSYGVWYEILDGARPTGTITLDDDATGGAVLLGFPIAGGAPPDTSLLWQPGQAIRPLLVQ